MMVRACWFNSPVIARLDRATQYAAAYRGTSDVSGILDHPPSRMMTAVGVALFPAPTTSTQSLAHVLRRRRGDADRLLVLGNRNRQFARMQMQPRLAETRAVAIDIVADDWPALGRRMDPELVGAPGERFHGEPGETTGTPEHPPFGDRGLPFRVRLLPPASFDVLAPERQLDHALVRGGPAFHHGPIGLGDLAMLEQKPERSRCLAVATEDQAARGVLVKPVGQHRRPR